LKDLSPSVFNEFRGEGGKKKSPATNSAPASLVDDAANDGDGTDGEEQVSFFYKELDMNKC
jgi:hypothetical protein